MVSVAHLTMPLILEGCLSAQKALQGYETEPRELLGGTEEKSISPTPPGLEPSFFSFPALAPLGYRPGRSMAEMLNDFVQSNVFKESEEEDEVEDDHSKIEELHKKRNFLARYGH